MKPVLKGLFALGYMRTPFPHLHYVNIKVAMSSEDTCPIIAAGRYITRCVHPCASITNIIHMAKEMSLVDDIEEVQL